MTIYSFFGLNDKITNTEVALFWTSVFLATVFITGTISLTVAIIMKLVDTSLLS